MSYTPLQHLGSGAFGSVWKYSTPREEPFYAEHPVVAVKRVSYRDASVEREADTLSRLDHPGCIKLLRSFRDLDTGHLCLVQEFCDLGELTPAKVSREESSIWKILHHLADALQYIHNLAILHRDIKPQNILLKTGPSGKVRLRLADFGLSKMMDRVHYGSLHHLKVWNTHLHVS